MQHKRIISNPAYTQQTFGKFQMTADVRPFNTDALKASVFLLVLPDSPSPKRLISLILLSPIDSIDGFILHITRNNKYINDFKAKLSIEMYEEREVKPLHRIY